MGELPKDWTKTKLKDILSLEYGKSLPEKQRDDGQYPVFGSNGIVGGHSSFLIEGPGIVVGRKGSHGEVNWSHENFYPIDTTYYVSVSRNINLRWTYYLLLSLDLKSLNRSTAIPGLNRNDAYNLDVLLPPLPEQHLIVAKLDALFGRLDRLKVRLEKIPVLLRQFRQAVLTQAVTGKLTEEWRGRNGAESVEDYFYNLIQKRKGIASKRKGKTQIQLRTDLELFQVPENWHWCDLEFLFDESDTFCYGVVQPGKDVEDEQKLIRVQDIENGKILIGELRGISREVDNNYRRSIVKTNDLLITIVGTIGRTALVTDAAVGFNIARAIAKIPIKDFETRYVKIFIDSKFGQGWLIGDAREVARKTLNLDQLRTLPVPIPPIQEQTEIVRRVESLFAIADRIEARYAVLKERIDRLPQAILAKAFRGELVGADAEKEMKAYEMGDGLSMAAEG